MQHRIYKCPHSGLSGYPHLRGFAQYAFYVNQSGPRRSVRLIEVSVFQRVRIEGFHCSACGHELSGHVCAHAYNYYMPGLNALWLQSKLLITPLSE